MPLADLLPGRFGLAGRLPARIEYLRGPAGGVITLLRHLSWPGLTECDIGDEPRRRAAYGLVLSQGTRGDMARLLNARLLRRDWPAIGPALDARLRSLCERQFGLAPAPAGDQEA